jgi:Zn-dependent M28 family amino/carboxypeptidase
METARVLARYDLPFSVLFVLFSGEELDRLGSKYFVEHYDDLFDERVIAVINSDMLGYGPNGAAG